MAAVYDAMGNYVGDDGTDDAVIVDDSTVTDWDDSTTLDPAVGSLMNDFGPSQVGYFQSKINEFQQMLIAVDARRESLETLAADPAITDDARNAIFSALDQYYDKRDTFKLVANAYNDITGMLNYVGADIAPLSIPTGLGVFPAIVIPVGTLAIIGTAAALLYFAYSWLEDTKNIAKEAIASIEDPVKRDELTKKLGSSVFGGLFSGLGDSLKWVVIGGGILLLLVALK